jgi:hypothetical protein
MYNFKFKLLLILKYFNLLINLIALDINHDAIIYFKIY